LFEVYMFDETDIALFCLFVSVMCLVFRTKDILQFIFHGPIETVQRNTLTELFLKVTT